MFFMFGLKEYGRNNDLIKGVVVRRGSTVCLLGFLVIYNCCCSFLLIPLTIISACMEPGRRDKPVFDIKCFLSHSP